MSPGHMTGKRSTTELQPPPLREHFCKSSICLIGQQLVAFEPLRHKDTREQSSGISFPNVLTTNILHN